jgi:hypothetical protein
MSDNEIHAAERDEHRSAVRAMTEWDRAPYDDPQTYADTYWADGTRQ